MKVIIAPDKFKGSLSSFEVCNAISKGIKKLYTNAEVLEFPMADGGDGFSSVLKYYLNTQTVTCITVDPLHKPILATYQLDLKSNLAIIEVAAASGIVLLKKTDQNPLIASTYGTGLLILDAIKRGVKKIVLGLGGSATTDAGTGILSALGFSFEDVLGNRIEANGINLLHIHKIIPPSMSKFKDLQIELACDVQNTLYGLTGAAHIYAKQKGADENGVELLDEGLKKFANCLHASTSKEIANISGTGAAGGIAASLLCYFNTTLTSGIEIVINASSIKSYIDKTDLIITGEGKIDKQTLSGKVVAEIGALAFNNKIKAIAFCGILEASAIDIHKLNLYSAEGLVSDTVTSEDAIKNAKNLLKQKVMSSLTKYTIH